MATKYRKKRRLSLSERAVVHGRNWVPLKEREEERDCDPTCMDLWGENRLADFIDVNRGERRLLILWNRHINKYKGNVPGIRLLDQVVQEFIDEESEMIIEKDLYMNLISHLTTLH